jgi:hypothetical protein
MAQPLKICTKCLAALRDTADGEEDLASYLMGIGAGGVELVSPESCQARISGHTEITSAPKERTFADVSEGELNSAIKSFLKQLNLTADNGGEGWELGNAVRAEWLKAMEARRHENRGTGQ